MGCMAFSTLVHRASVRALLLPGPSAPRSPLPSWVISLRRPAAAVPSVVLLLAAGAGRVWRVTERSAAASASSYRWADVLESGVGAAPAHAPAPEEIKPVLSWMSPQVGQGDVLYVHSRAAHAFAFLPAHRHFRMNSAIVVQVRLGPTTRPG